MTIDAIDTIRGVSAIRLGLPVDTVQGDLNKRELALLRSNDSLQLQLRLDGGTHGRKSCSSALTAV